MIENDYRSLKFLIVDDFETFQKILKRLLHGLSAEHIDTALNGAQAVKSCQQNKYDVIFCDFDLGRGINGLQVLEELRHLELLKSSSVFIMVTAESGRDAVVGAMEYKPDAYMSKPVSSGELQSRLVKSLKQKQALAPLYRSLDNSDFNQAIKECDKHISESGRHKNFCLKTKGNLLLKLEHFKEAQDIYEGVLKERPLFWAQLGLAHVLAAQDLNKEAHTAFQKAYEENPASLEAFEGAARALVKLGDAGAAQRLLEQSSTISSRSVTRQKLLSEVCKINGDFEAAADASRRVVKLAEYGIHKSADNDLDLADNLTEAALQSQDEEKTKDLANEALSTLKKTEKEYKNSEVDIQSKLVESRTHASLNHDKLAQQALMEAEQKMEASGSKSLRTQLELTKSYFQTGHKDKANELLKSLAEQYKMDDKISAMLDRLTDEPVTQSGKKEVVKINKKGIAMFGEGEYQKAIELFSQAIQKFPKHLGLRLNVIQSFLFDMKQHGPSQKKLALCENHISIIKGMDENSKQYKRYLSFKTALKALNQHLNKKAS
ncbi:MAG: response regulator [Bermanella sp.]